MKLFHQIIGWLVAVTIPFYLIMTAIRLLLFPAFINIEYRLTNFPVDPYGFTQADRLKWAQISLDYLSNDKGIDFLGNQHLSDGSPLFNSRELSHMKDVKTLIQTMLTAWWIISLAFVVIVIWAYRSGWMKIFWQRLATGGWFGIGLIVLILFMLVINFDALFTDFHHLFFTGDTWLFYTTDNLIRLFPIKFWEDAFIAMGGITALASIGCILLGSSRSKKG